ncbi:MAG: hypothetical protein AAFO75_00195 [Pseudomonadota bacterium]
MRILRPMLAVACVAATFPSLAMADQSGMADMHDQRREGSKICLSDHFHTGTGEGRTKRAARADAIKAWQEFTAWEYGLDWAYFRRAASKSVGVQKASNGWEAVIEGRPCRRR